MKSVVALTLLFAYVGAFSDVDELIANMVSCTHESHEFTSA